MLLQRSRVTAFNKTNKAANNICYYIFEETATFLAQNAAKSIVTGPRVDPTITNHLFGKY